MVLRNSSNHFPFVSTIYTSIDFVIDVLCSLCNHKHSYHLLYSSTIEHISSSLSSTLIILSSTMTSQRPHFWPSSSRSLRHFLLFVLRKSTLQLFARYCTIQLTSLPSLILLVCLLQECWKCFLGSACRMCQGRWEGETQGRRSTKEYQAFGHFVCGE